ncbi:MAG: 5-formyltetrahydrofolate cyclo-ligase [Bacteroidota bacterium]
MADLRLHAEKAALRARFRDARLALTDAEAAAHSTAICERIAALPEVKAAGTVHVYWPVTARREVDTRPLVRRLHGAGTRVVLPVVADFDGAPRLRHVRFEGEDRMQTNHWGIAEPVGTADADPSDLDVVIVPAFGAGRGGHRIGHGRGFYDAFLAGLAAVTVGAVYAACLVDAVPAEAHDVALGIVVTEREVVRVGTGERERGEQGG